MKYSIIIPCYNEKDNIDNLIEQIIPLQAEYDLEYVLVENGSTDGSKEYFEKHVDGKYKNISIAYVPKNKGYGYGIQEGIKASSGMYIGWIHADMQTPPEILNVFFNTIESMNTNDKIFIKGIRTNRNACDKIFTCGQTIFDSVLFGEKLYDIGAIPILFNRELIDVFGIDNMPNDFSIDLFVYKEALENNYKIIRHKYELLPRIKGDSSWKRGLRSRIRQSKVIIRDSLKIKNGEKIH